MSFEEVFTLSFAVTWLAGAVRLGGPLLLAAVGEIYAERSGILNVGIEGTILIGALAAFLFTHWTGLPGFGVVAALVAGLLANLFLAWMYVTVMASQVVVGIIFNLFAMGLASYVYRATMGSGSMTESIAMLPNVSIPLLSEIPLVGPVLFSQSIMLYVTLAVVLAGGWLLFRTRFGLNLRAVGENPKAAAAAGIRVRRMRYIGTMASGAGAGMAGAYMVLSQIGIFRDNIVQGHGFIALAIVILGRWNPVLAIFAAFGFGAADALPLSLQMLNLDVPPQVLLAMPYLMTIVVISGLLGRVSQPASLMIPFRDE